jgi:transposase-like protein
MEAHVNRVSTRKVDRLVEQLGIVAMTKDRVSALCRSLDEQLERGNVGSSALGRSPRSHRVP